MRIDAIKIGENPPDDVNVLIEVPVGGHPIKYEMDKDAGTLVVDRFLYTPMTYPGNCRARYIRCILLRYPLHIAQLFRSAGRKSIWYRRLHDFVPWLRWATKG